MQAWRIAKRIHALDRLGTGARADGGRWNSVGIAAIYAGLTPEIATLEKLVHTGDTLPPDLVLVLIELPDDDLLYARLDTASLPTGWADLPSSPSAATIGDEFITGNQKLGLIIPSAVVPESQNIVINPNHAEFHRVTMSIVRAFTFDARLGR
jgi:RES domain-containing protein